jgi:hypothetical protein
VATVEAPPCGTSERVGRSRHANDIDEQRTGPPFRQQPAFEHLHVVGEIVAGELWVAKLHHQVRYCVAMKDRERGVGIIPQKAILPLTPQRNELTGGNVPGQTRGPVGEIC